MGITPRVGPHSGLVVGLIAATRALLYTQIVCAKVFAVQLILTTSWTAVQLLFEWSYHPLLLSSSCTFTLCNVVSTSAAPPMSAHGLRFATNSTPVLNGMSCCAVSLGLSGAARLNLSSFFSFSLLLRGAGYELNKLCFCRNASTKQQHPSEQARCGRCPSSSLKRDTIRSTSRSYAV